MEYFFNTYFDKTALFFAANIIYCLAYVVTSMIWLRMLTIIAALCTFPYFYYQLEPLWSALLWQSAFLGINLVNLGVQLAKLRPTRFSVENESLYQTVFSGLLRREAAKLFKVAKRESARRGEQLLNIGQSNDGLLLIVSGFCNVKKNGISVAQVGAGQFVSEMSFISNDPISANVYAHDDVTYLKWDKDTLAKLYRKSSVYKNYLDNLLGVQIVEKLRIATVQLSAVA